MIADWPKPAASSASAAVHTRAAPGVRALLGGLVAIVLVPSALLAAGLVVYSYERAKDQTQEAALATARLIAARVDGRLTELRPGLQALASSPALAQGNLAAFLQHAQHFVQVNAAAVNVTLVDATGTQVLNTARPRPGAAVRGQPEVVDLLRGGDLAVTNLFRGPVLAEPLMAIGVPARVNGQVAYAVGAALRPRSLENVIEALPEGWTAVILDRQGQIVARRPWRDEFVGQPAAPNLVAASLNATSGTIATRTRDGTPELAAFVRAPQTGYTASIGVSEQILLAPVRRDAMIAAVVIFAVLVVSWLAAGRLAARIAGSIGYLSDSVRDPRKGHVAGAPRMGFREAEQVRLALNISAAELQHMHAELDQLNDPKHHIALAAAVIEPTGSPLLLVNARGSILARNTAARRMLGARADGALALGQLFVADDGAYGGSVPGVATLADGSRRRAVLRSTELPIAGADVSCVAIELVETG